MRNILHFTLLSSIFLSFGFTNIQTTASLGHFQDIEKESHTSVYFHIRYHYTHSSGPSSYFDLGLNNNLYSDDWNAIPYMAAVEIPFDNGFENAPFHQSRVILGRQMLTEGFDLEMIDGVIFPYYFTPDFSLTGFAGGVHEVEEEDFNGDDQIYGLSLRFKILKTKFQLTPTVKSKDDAESYFTTLSARKVFPFDTFTTSLFIKEQWDIEIFVDVIIQYCTNGYLFSTLANFLTFFQRK